MVRTLQHCPARLKEKNKLNEGIDRDVKGKEENCEDDMAQKGMSLSEELRRAGVTQWNLSGCVMYVGQAKENASKLSATNLENGVDENGVALTSESAVTPCIIKKRRISINNLEAAEAVSCEEQARNDHKVRGQSGKVERWSVKRYNRAQQSVLDVLKEEGAVFGKPISRQNLRAAARKHIGDTGLLDHLLKHISGQVTPGGRERIRRSYNSNGVMEYWLESADIDQISRISGWITPGDAPQRESVNVEELKLLKAEMDKFKRDVLRIVTKDLEMVKDTLKEEMREELVKWNCILKQRLSMIQKSVSDVQDMSRDIMSWKAKVEQQIMELSNAVNTLQATKNGTTLCPDKWDDLLEGIEPENIQAEDLPPWWESSSLLYADEKLEFKTENAHPVDPILHAELSALKDELANVKREMTKLMAKKHDKDQSGRTADSAVSAKSKLDAGNTPMALKHLEVGTKKPSSSKSYLQEMCTEMAKWKTKVDKQMYDLANSVAGILASKELPPV